MNVLLVTADQWRGDTLGILGHPCVCTPNLDALAGDGLVFSRHYSQASPCAPGRASLYTGLYLKNHRVVANDVPLDARHTNVALECRRAGFDPVLFGYTDTSWDPRYPTEAASSISREYKVLPGMTPIVPAGDVNVSWLDDLRDKGYDVPSGEAGVYRPLAGVSGADERGPTHAPALYCESDTEAAFLTNKVMEYWSANGGKPWFVHLSVLSPHPPFVAPRPYNDWYSPDEVPLPVRADSPATEALQHPFASYSVYNQQGSGLFYGHDPKDNLKLSDRDVLQARATYYAMMSEVDHQIGRLIHYLKDNGLYDDTMIVFTSDHGEQLGDHWQFAKYSYFGATFHIPAIVRVPSSLGAVVRGAKVDRFTEAVDIMPTILDCLDLEIPVQCDGKSLKPFLMGQDVPGWRTEAHYELDFRDFGERPDEPILELRSDQCAFAVLHGERYKYVHFAALPALLFDLYKDPGEFVNLAVDSDYRDIVMGMAQQMLSWRMTHEDRLLTNTRSTQHGVVEYRPEAP